MGNRAASGRRNLQAGRRGVLHANRYRIPRTIIAPAAQTNRYRILRTAIAPAAQTVSTANTPRTTCTFLVRKLASVPELKERLGFGLCSYMPLGVV